MSTVEVRSIDALEELQDSLIRYADHAQLTLDAAQRELHRTLDWLEERQRHWRNEIARRQELERLAQAALARCMNSGDSRRPPSCGAEQQAVYEARRRLAEAQQEERMATQARQAVQAEAEAYLREASRLRAIIQSDTPKAVATLRHKVTTLRAYTGGGVSAGDLAAGALVSGAGLAIGAVVGGFSQQEASQGVDDGGQPPPLSGAGREPPIQLLHPEIRNVLLDQIDLSDSPVHDATDFRKVSHEEMVAGLGKLQQVQRWIEQGATDQMLWEIDQEKGLIGGQGYHNIYRVFYADSPIVLEKVGDGYRVTNGYHRLAVAKELGWTTIPALVVG